MGDDVAIASERDLHETVTALARTKRIVLLAGLPGVGKSLYLRELALAARAIGRPVHLLQWDIVRPAFVSPATEARYPERDGQTHAMLRKAIGRWARAAVLRWHRDHDPTHVLIGEVPLVGDRLLDLARVQPDDAEPLLAGPDALFVTPVPSTAVRAAIESARSRTFANPAHPRERADAPPDLLQRLWQDVHSLAAAIGAAVAPADGRAPYDPDAYAAVYRRLLRHRPALTLRIGVQLAPRASVYELGFVPDELVPTAAEVSAVIAQLEDETSLEVIEHEVAGWFEKT